MLEEALRAGVAARRLHVVGGGDRPGARAARTADETQPFDAGALRAPLRHAKHEAETRGAARRRPRAAGGDRQPGPRARPRRPVPLLDRARPPLPAPRDPRLRRRRAERRRRRGRRPRAPAGRRARPRRASATSWATATSRSTASSPTSGASRASSRRRSSCRCPRRWPSPGPPRRCPGGRRSPRPRSALASLWWAYRSTKAKRELGWKPSHHEDTLEATIDWYREREPLRLRAPGARQPLGLRVAGFGVRSAGGVLSRLAP